MSIFMGFLFNFSGASLFNYYNKILFLKLNFLDFRFDV